MSDIQAKFNELVARRDSLLTKKMQLDAEHEARKRALKTAMENCKKAGYDPDTLEETIKKMKEVLDVKMSVFEADLTTAENQIRPLLKEIG